MILLLDNYDSFTYNLYQYLCEMDEEVKVFRNDHITVEEIEALAPEAIIVSPGPGIPEDAGISVDVITRLYKKIPILGVCLGHQAIGKAFGATIEKAKTIMHGKTSFIEHNGKDLFKNIQVPFKVMRYHSLVIEEKSMPAELEITARSTDDHEIMAVKHREYKVFGVQFHPESIGTEEGKAILRNFLEEVRRVEQYETIS
ncbi:anthranilate synthase component II [Heyndrickxia ginsengihumi]|uniref:Aminodeoxychorismate/anthranilate synthase component II n=1 Tax=Heyndrickxia ginsengihumi TaxID=363870 RepID=A0A0A6VCZ0_9BACI|nr:aminodeoxychorismate/anthranilate synthase component II [Heyndrickxia ginsengihumi]KHD84389.1 anthranilate synthase subunit II [Heyndrickxia ginsengihumi]MBE6183538.1 aminodeoxychorismate/anthranilate synthase component II [Bacillus sp. (in: firmicutes)]NEY20178.1 aminodeoxychorismate/anthranilate synthase component II [Heyndrickxia ginsengihumi]